MNIAILFYGQLRWFDIFHESFQKRFLPSFKNDNIQYFSHFWSEPNNPKIDEFNILYNPIISKIEQQRPFNDLKLKLGSTKCRFSEKLYSQLYSLYESFCLLENYQQNNNIIFDMYIKLRTDIVFLDNVNINNFDNNSVYTNKTSFPIDKYINDFVFFTKKYDDVKTISNIGFYLDHLINLIDADPVQDVLWHRCPTELAPEEILSKHLNQNNIVPKHFDFIIDLARHHTT